MTIFFPPGLPAPPSPAAPPPPLNTLSPVNHSIDLTTGHGPVALRIGWRCLASLVVAQRSSNLSRQFNIGRTYTGCEPHVSRSGLWGEDAWPFSSSLGRVPTSKVTITSPLSFGIFHWPYRDVATRRYDSHQRDLAFHSPWHTADTTRPDPGRQGLSI